MSSYGGGVAAALGAPLVMTIGFIVWQDHWKGSAFALNLYKCCTASLGFLVLSLTVTPIDEETESLRDEGLFPSNIFTARAVGFLFLSSTIGIVIGDWTWLQALQMLGARRVILMDSLKPFLAAFFGWLLLEEDLRPIALCGIVLTVAGILIVSLEQTEEKVQEDDTSEKEEEINPTVELSSSARSLPDEVLEDVEEESKSGEAMNCGAMQEAVDLELSDLPLNDDGAPSLTPVPEGSSKPRQTKKLQVGFALSILNVVLDTYGAVLIKEYGTSMTVWEINLIRFGFAGAVMLIVSTFFSIHACTFSNKTAIQEPPRTENPTSAVSESKIDTRQQSGNDTSISAPWYALPVKQMTRSSWLHVSAGVVLVTFLTPTLSNYALFQIALGLALTLGSTGPLYELPLSYMMQKKVPTLRSLAGAILAVAGIVVLAFRGTLPKEE